MVGWGWGLVSREGWGSWSSLIPLMASTQQQTLVGFFCLVFFFFFCCCFPLEAGSHYVSLAVLELRSVDQAELTNIHQPLKACTTMLGSQLGFINLRAEGYITRG